MDSQYRPMKVKEKKKKKEIKANLNVIMVDGS